MGTHRGKRVGRGVEVHRQSQHEVCISAIPTGATNTIQPRSLSTKTSSESRLGRYAAVAKKMADSAKIVAPLTVAIR